MDKKIKTLSQTVYDFRIKKGLSVEEFAKQIGISGMMLYFIEKGKSIIEKDGAGKTLTKLSKTMQIPHMELLNICKISKMVDNINKSMHLSENKKRLIIDIILSNND